MQNYKKYKGAIVEESLEDKKVLSDFDIVETTVTDDENPDDRWHIHKVLADAEQIEKLSKFIKPTKWYANFWTDPVRIEDGNIIVAYRDKVFSFHKDDEVGRGEAIQYGLSVDIPLEQLDFFTE
ncbi:MAG: hypothetical protein WCJ74_03185 [bacterium]